MKNNTEKYQTTQTSHLWQEKEAGSKSFFLTGRQSNHHKLEWWYKLLKPIQLLDKKNGTFSQPIFSTSQANTLTKKSYKSFKRWKEQGEEVNNSQYLRLGKTNKALFSFSIMYILATMEVLFNNHTQ